MELASNGELYTYIQKKHKLAEKEASRLFAQLLLGIEYIHQMGIVHRDLKPENLLLQANGYLKLTDFGLSKLITTRTYTFCGTPEYMSPE